MDMVPTGGIYGTVLQAASAWANPRIIALLLEKGANLNVQGAICVKPVMFE
jgi:hypothetical protein